MTTPEIVPTTSAPVEVEATTATPETPESSLDKLVSTLTADQLAQFLAQIPQDTLRALAGNQKHPLGAVVQSEADRRMESWRQNELRRQNTERQQTEAVARQRWLETAPDDEVAARIRDEQRTAQLSERMRYQQFVAMFNELKPMINSLPPERRAKVEAFIQSPGADEQWFKLPTLVYSEYDEHQSATAAATARTAAETDSARQTAAAVSSAPPTDVNRGTPAPAGSQTNDLLRDFGEGRTSDLKSAAAALHEMGVKVPTKLLK